ncbi:hypothetical protein [Agrobacterium sp. lyk4-40-TYG-31]|uniref:hypothetical protein n=1 Tax=Agrobacterium sp. lyk4-40-TYG-31 TaxID=3040276 RepID=UPI00254AC270|nr:hypothetical protein [Agrobacterium sp. lyk4-40-TYG-31]
MTELDQEKAPTAGSMGVEKLEIRFGALEKVTERTHLIVTWAVASISVMVALLIAAGGALAWIQYSSLSKEVSLAVQDGKDQLKQAIDQSKQAQVENEKKIIALTESGRVQDVAINNQHDDDPIVYGQVYISVEKWNTGLLVYTLSAEIPLRYNFEGSATNKFLGTNVRYPSKFIETLYPDTPAKERSGYLFGHNQYLEDSQTVIAGQDHYQSFVLSKRSADCGMLSEIAEKLVVESDLGSISVTPIYEIANLKLRRRSLDLAFRYGGFLRSCSDLRSQTLETISKPSSQSVQPSPPHRPAQDAIKP